MKVIRISLGDVLRNKFFIPVLLCLNAIYAAIHFLPDKMYNNMVRELEAAYVILLVFLILPMMYSRYGDHNRAVIQTVIYPKIKRSYLYNLAYHLWIAACVFILYAISALVILFTPNADILRQLLFALHLLVTACILLQLYVIIITIIQRYLIVAAVYLIALFLLVLYNAPTSYLWFEYYIIEYKQYDNLHHWIGKGILLLCVTSCNGILRLRLKHRIRND